MEAHIARSAIELFLSFSLSFFFLFSAAISALLRLAIFGQRFGRDAAHLQELHHERVAGAPLKERVVRGRDSATKMYGPAAETEKVCRKSTTSRLRARISSDHSEPGNARSLRSGNERFPKTLSHYHYYYRLLVLARTLSLHRTSVFRYDKSGSITRLHPSTLFACSCKLVLRAYHLRTLPRSLGRYCHRKTNQRTDADVASKVDVGVFRPHNLVLRAGSVSSTALSGLPFHQGRICRFRIWEAE